MAKIIISLTLFNNFKLDDDTKVLTIDTGLYAPSGLRFEERFFGEHYLVYETKHSKHRNSEPTDDPSVAPPSANATEPPKEEKPKDTNFCDNCLNFNRPALQCNIKPHPIKFGGECHGFQAIKQDSEKSRMELLPFDALLGVGTVLAHGAHKYKEHSWQHVNKDRYIGALLRHLAAYQRGEITDPESGLPHLDHLACNALFISALEKRAPCLNDRVVSPGEVSRYVSSL